MHPRKFFKVGVPVDTESCDARLIDFNSSNDSVELRISWWVATHLLVIVPVTHKVTHVNELLTTKGGCNEHRCTSSRVFCWD